MNNLQVTPIHDLFALACKGASKWGIFISFPPCETNEDNEELLRAAPYLSGLNPIEISYVQLLGNSTFFFDTEQEMLNIFSQTVGDDGPTHSNPYSGSFRVYAITCSPKGILLSENT